MKMNKGFLVVSKSLYALLASTSMSLRILLVAKRLEILIATSTIWFCILLMSFLEDKHCCGFKKFLFLILLDKLVDFISLEAGGNFLQVVDIECVYIAMA